LETKNRNIGIVTDKELIIGEVYKIKILLKISDIVPDYINYPDENLPINSILDLVLEKNGFKVKFDEIIYIDQQDGIDLVEGNHFKFI
jgi:hypothetical protein